MFAIRNTFRAVRPALARKTFTPRVAAPIARRSYHEKVIDHYTNPRNVGSLNGKDPNVGSGLVGAPACGDVMKLDIQVDEKTGTIIDARFKTFGCGSAIASSSYVTTLVKGKRLEEAAKIRNVDIASELCLPPVKLHCSMLAEDAIQAAIANYKSKRTAFTPSNLSGTAKTLESA
ncbi:Iron sulfur cluster assembly protein 1, mitochondrial [Ceratocystis fimbriata CBS 114723]|uniref:Iron-sulfur cluster assembly protein n=1 Tax=Ceratocystis fimbriata CBS 114723 TaxID=1035309 RepID=A0A2C5XH74_9PEZI|nr:Iron sulfur cluster assembly protein 1, mitochondrial [Ceratocystis fimbriata CBS 114723]